MMGSVTFRQQTSHLFKERNERSFLDEVDLVQSDQYRSLELGEALGNLGISRGQPMRRIEQEERDVGFLQGTYGSINHVSVEQRLLTAMNPRRINKNELGMRLGFDPGYARSRRLGFGRDDGNRRPYQRIEQR